MTDDYSESFIQEEATVSGKTPKASSIHFLKQFARVCSTVGVLDLSYCILN